MSNASGPRFRVRDAMHFAMLIALVCALAIQGRQLLSQAQRIKALEAASLRIEQQNLQLANALMSDQRARAGELSGLRRDLEALRTAGAKTVESGPAPEPPPGPSTRVAATIPTGLWVMESVERDGQMLSSGERAARVLIVVDGEHYHTETDGKVESRWAITFDPSESPARFDATIENGKYQGQVMRGIYRIDGDRWIACNGPPGGDRPSEFATPAGSPNTLVVARRRPER